MRLLRLLAPLLATLALLATPPLATADSGRLSLPLSPPAGLPPQLRAAVASALGGGTAPAGFQPLLELKARHGYRLGIAGAGNAVLFEVIGAHGRAATAYVVRGTATPRLLRARFGKLGSVSVRFHPAAAQPNPAARPPRCRDTGGLLVRRGVYVGHVHFRGEGGYIAVDAHRAKGRISRPDPRCASRIASVLEPRSTRPSPSVPFGLEPKALIASWRHGTGSASFAALDFLRTTLFFASAEESVGAMAKVRFAFKVGSSKALSIDDALTRARVSPPAPFRGRGIYQAAPDGTATWTGPLSIDYPGAPRSPLTGDPFGASVSAGF